MCILIHFLHLLLAFTFRHDLVTKPREFKTSTDRYQVNPGSSKQVLIDIRLTQGVQDKRTDRYRVNPGRSRQVQIDIR